MLACLRLAAAAPLAVSTDVAAAAPLAVPTDAAPVTITNKILSVTLDAASGITLLTELVAPFGAKPLKLGVAKDGWSVDICPKVHDAANCTAAAAVTLSPASANCSSVAPSRAATPSNATLAWRCAGGAEKPGPSGFPLSYTVEVTYSLKPGARFVSKTLRVGSSRPESAAEGAFVVASVRPYEGLTLDPGGGSAASRPFTWLKFMNAAFSSHPTLEVAGFGRWEGTGRGVFLSVANPWSKHGTAPPAHAAPPFCPAGSAGKNHPGSDLSSSGGVPMPTIQECAAACDKKAGCEGFVYLPTGCNGQRQNNCYLKSNATAASGREPECACLVAKPWPHFPPPAPSPSRGATLFAEYSPDYVQCETSAASAYEAEPALLGLTALSKYYRSAADGGQGISTAEHRAFVRCVEAHLLDQSSRADKSVKVNVAWDESDYQIDVGTEAGRTEYKRIIDRNSQLGVTHIVYEPRNTLVSSRFNTTDGWGWEGSLWLSMGEQLREGSWDPRRDAFIPEILQMIDYAAAKNVKLMGYVYPCLLFQSQPQAWQGGAMDLSDNKAADWLLEVMLAFLKKTGGAGFAWDHNIYAGFKLKQYAQWRSWMRILRTLREHFPEMVMDHRQTAHIWGPWYQLAGSYVEPIAGDENPESYGVPIASLHTDHVAGDHTRGINFKYSQAQLQPPARIPGFIFHQTERTADNGTMPCFSSSKLCYDDHVRDFDLMGYKYSVLSTVGTAGLNLVLTMIPARDPEEFKLFPAKDVAWIQRWVKFTDANLDYLKNTMPIATLGAPQLGAVDGTAAMSAADEGYLFLFNPGFTPLNASLLVDESLDISNASTADTWEVTQLYPDSAADFDGSAVLGNWKHGQRVAVAVGGSDARVLKLTKRKKTGASKSEKVSELALAPAPAPASLPLASLRGAVHHAMPISADRVPPGFGGGVWKASFSIDAAIPAQMKARAAEYPVTWTAEDRVAAWLDQTRLLGYIFISNPQDSMKILLTIDGKAVKVVKAYNSRGVVHASCFLGFYFDATAMMAADHAAGRAGAGVDAGPKQHALAVSIDPEAAKGGGFEGIFWQNID